MWITTYDYQTQGSVEDRLKRSNEFNDILYFLSFKASWNDFVVELEFVDFL